MASRNDVRRIALALPDTIEAEDRFAFSVLNRGKPKDFVWVWHERVEPKKPRVPNPKVIAVRVANVGEKEMLIASDPDKSSPSRTTTASRPYSCASRRSRAAS
jgi:hypothetical protein